MTQLTIIKLIQQQLIRAEQDALPNKGSLTEQCFFNAPQPDLSGASSYNLLQLFQSIETDSKFIWSSRDQSLTYLGLGIAHQFADSELEHLTQMKQLNNNFMLWGGQGFSKNTQNYFIPCVQFFLNHKLAALMTNSQTIHQETIPEITHEKIHEKIISDQLIQQELIVEVTLNFNENNTSLITLLNKLNNFFSSTKSNHNKNNQRNIMTKPLASISSLTRLPNKESWQQQIKQALIQIELQHFKKVVLARKISFDLNLETELAPWLLFLNSVSQNRNCFHLFWQMNQDEVLVSASPERLLFRHDDSLITEALAGTVKKRNNQKQNQILQDWLTHDDKNKRENELVVQDIMTQLHPFVRKWTSRPLPQILQQRQIQHLKVTIATTLKQDPFINDSLLLETLHPTAAIAGFPRKNAMKFITNKEPFSRHWYSGYFGYHSMKQSEYSVLIRCAFFHKTEAQKWQCHCYAGAGIIKGSDADDEWQEIDDKLTTLMDLFDWV